MKIERVWDYFVVRGSGTEEEILALVQAEAEEWGVPGDVRWSIIDRDGDLAIVSRLLRQPEPIPQA